MAVFSLEDHSENLSLKQMPSTGMSWKSYLKGETKGFLKPQKKIVKVESDNSVFIYLIACHREENRGLCCSKKQNKIKQVSVSRRLVSIGYFMAI